MKRVVAALLALFIVIVGLLSPTDRVAAHEGNAIAVCCAWGMSLSDGILTYKLSGGDEAVQNVIRAAVTDWDTKVAGLTLIEVSGNTKADINIKFKKGGGQIQGQALRKSSGTGFITSCDLNVSGQWLGFPNDTDTLAKISKHEFGHCLGLGHANFDGNVMSPTVNAMSLQIDGCAVNAVIAANHWKLVDGAATPHAPHENHVHCEP